MRVAAFQGEGAAEEHGRVPLNAKGAKKDAPERPARVEGSQNHAVPASFVPHQGQLQDTFGAPLLKPRTLPARERIDAIAISHAVQLVDDDFMALSSREEMADVVQLRFGRCSAGGNHVKRTLRLRYIAVDGIREHGQKLAFSSHGRRRNMKDNSDIQSTVNIVARSTMQYYTRYISSRNEAQECRLWGGKEDFYVAFYG
ncbi:hypothetical protein HPB48_009632 [Haemaphysalis longicornis]|uniref:Uncharacterized protein n=1 Tax=Haemaphysalis longicornis TaxID=44386 RepID=A0A9J6GDE3_HAELO|nr:hypothetical protein HPB48_009632 [Haemaphysalis longicornis]